MTADRWTQTVRHQLGLGRLLPLGGAHEGAWISEEAAEAVLRRAVRDLRGVRLDRARISLADPEDVHDPVVPPPPSALPPGPLRVTAEFAATADEPLPATATLLRTALATAAERLGLTVTEVDLRVTSLLDEEPEAGPVRRPEPPSAEPAGDPVAAAVLSVPGVTGLTAALGRAVHVEERQGEAALPRRHVRVEVAVDAEHRAVEVARAVRREVGKVLPDHPTVAVLVTAVG
ncbi:nucleopolyhedrovirus P10 family protein [Streptomyces sp. NPDC021056]|uniref:nucleopolyhedrovirus P10 family protein n=1 Tax=Streptomyces sp. NPDC021056 TaxID=3155012 RepID=UPI0033D0C530